MTKSADYESVYCYMWSSGGAAVIFL